MLLLNKTQIFTSYVYCLYSFFGHHHLRIGKGDMSGMIKNSRNYMLKFISPNDRLISYCYDMCNGLGLI